ncbi:MAG: DnaJ C-terminal domain-containing protein [Amphiplicatus sp.]
MARDPYLVLGVAPAASDSDIRAAFRKLAKQHHPDRNPGDKKAEEKFKEISAAFDILGDAERRKRFDRGEIDADGRERASWARPGQRPGENPFEGYQRGPGYSGAGASFEDLGDIFSDLFGAGAGARGPRGPAPRGRDLRYRLDVDFLDAVKGATKRVTMPDGRTLDISIPAGVDDGQTLRLRGQGEKAPNDRGQGGTAGDVYVELKVKPHPVFTREGADIHVEAPVSLKEAVLGGKITAPTIDGDVSVTVPRMTSSGAVLRLKGRGAPQGKAARGDEYVKLRIVLPEGGDPELEDFMRRWKGGERQGAKKNYAGA